MHFVDGVDDHDVHQVMGVEDEIQVPGKPPLRDVDHSDEGSGDSNGILVKEWFWFESLLLKFHP